MRYNKRDTNYVKNLVETKTQPNVVRTSPYGVTFVSKENPKTFNVEWTRKYNTKKQQDEKSNQEKIGQKTYK